MSEPIRILHVVQRMEAGGTQAFLMNLYRNIDRNKVQFDFLVEYKEKEFYDDEILNLGGRIYYTDFRKSLNVIKFKKEFSEILIKNPQYKIIHIHATAIGKICTDVARKNKIPVIIAHTHNNGAVKDWKYFPKKILRMLYRNGPTDFFACSNEAGKYTFKNKNFTVIHNAIDTKKFLYNEGLRNKKRKELKVEDKFVVGNVGRLHEQKNQKFLIDVFFELQKEKQNSVLIIIGTGPLKNELHTYVKKLGIEEKVRFLENRSDMNELYQAMDIFVLPSLFEGLGIVAIEAQAAGLPVIASTEVSKEAEVTENIKKLNLKDPIKYWVMEILNFKVKDRTSVLNDIKKAGYDIEENAKIMEKYYLNKYFSINKY